MAAECTQHRRTPVLGDDVYGNKDWNRRLQQSTGMTRPLLHAHSLEFEHPGTGEVVSLVAPLPDDVESVVKRIYPQVQRVRRKLTYYLSWQKNLTFGETMEHEVFDPLSWGTFVLYRARFVVSSQVEEEHPEWLGTERRTGGQAAQERTEDGLPDRFEVPEDLRDYRIL